MHLPILLLPALLSLARCTPTPLDINEARFHLDVRANCNVSAITQPPAAPTPLPAPPAGTHNILVAIGKGTQNYTCGSSGSTVPTPVGAIATLYNASCLAASNPSALASLTRATKDQDGSPGSGFPVVGHHYFSSPSTPVFQINGVGNTALTRKAVSDPPPNQSGDVAWLYLEAQAAGSTDNVKAVYRVNTAGGSPPPTCQGQPAVISVKYAADYYFYSM